ncbi:MAG: hypothetical protein AB8B55_15510 [Mariniblastus sp.]
MKNLFLSAKLWMVFAALILGFVVCSPVQAQGFGRPTNSRVQLPVLRFFNVRTVVMVPDGGTISLGGVSRHAEGQSSRGVPGLRGPLFQNRSRGSSTGGGHASVTARIISTREMEQAVLAEANYREKMRAASDPNGSRAVQAKADFISQNIGRTRK